MNTKIQKITIMGFIMLIIVASGARAFFLFHTLQNNSASDKFHDKKTEKSGNSYEHNSPENEMTQQQETISGSQTTGYSSQKIYQSSRKIHQKEQNPTKEKITILVPKRVSASAFHELRKNIYKSKKVRSNIVIADNYDDYKTKLQEQYTNPTVDIILVPTRYRNTFQDRGVHIPFQISLSEIFHPLFWDLIEHDKASMIPFALDPLVIRYQEGFFSNKHKLGFLDLQISIESYTGTYPFSFGIHQDDATILEYGYKPYPQYLTFLALVFQQSKQSGGTYIFNFFEQIKSRNAKKILEKARTYDSPCLREARLCLLSYTQWGASLGRMSDAGYTKNIFRTKIDDRYLIHHFPLLAKQYPVQGWGFLINKKSQKLQESGEWIKGYLEHGPKQLSLRDTTLSAFNTQFQQQSMRSDIYALQGTKQARTLYIGGLGDETHMIKETPLLDLIRGNRNISIFLDRFVK